MTTNPDHHETRTSLAAAREALAAYRVAARDNKPLGKSVLDALSSPEMVPISIYLETTEDADAIEAAVKEVADQLGLDILSENPPVLGSWFKNMLARGRAEFTEDRVRTVVEGAVRAVELEQIDKRQAQVNATNIGAIADLIDKLVNTPAAVIQIGSLILIKTPDTLVVRELTQAEQATLRDNPILLVNPEAAAAVLAPDQRGNVSKEEARPQLADG